MRVTKLIPVRRRLLASTAGLLLASSAIDASAQRSEVKDAPKAIIARSDVRELPADQQIIQALNRLTFGPKPGDVLRVRAIGLDNWIDQQLHPERINDAALDQFVDGYSALNQNQNDLLRDYAEQQRARRAVKRQSADTTMSMNADDSAAMRQLRQQANTRREVITQLQSSRVARAVASERQLQEVMTDFWENHFNVYAAKGAPEPYYLVDYDQNVIRPNALGKFRDLLEAVAKSPAMLFYLDNARSMADSNRPVLTGSGMREAGGGRRRIGGAIGAMRAAQQIQRQQQQPKRQRQGLNENYGRELLELHTLGVDGGYTQQDVINVARAFTGWTIKPPALGGGFIFRPQVHDAGEKIVLGHKLSAGRGMEDAEDVLDILARSPATARFISLKLARRFVSDSPSKTLVDHGAQVYLKTDGDIREVLRAIITSPEFFSQQAFRSKVKSPFEVVVSAMRALNAAPDRTPRAAQVIAYLGQPIFGHQAPNGWPETGESWMNTGAILNRINFGMAVAAGRLPGADIRGLPALDTIGSAPRGRQVDAVVASILNGMVSPDTRAVLVSGEHPMLKREAGSGKGEAEMRNEESGMSAPEPTLPASRFPRPALGNIPQLTGLPQIVGLALGSPEFQRR
ncbi:MAG: DUF1800 domain-containing protein [Gemmatimonadaceae bacterium]